MYTNIDLRKFNFFIVTKWPYFCKKADQGLRVKPSCTKMYHMYNYMQHLSYIMWISQVVKPTQYEEDTAYN